MATQGSGLRDQGAAATRNAMAEKLSMVVDCPATGDCNLLILPFSTPQGEEVLGRRIAELVQRRMRAVPEVVTGHGLLVLTGPEGRRYAPIHHALSDEQAYSCSASWRAQYVLSGSITLTPALRWSLTLRDTTRKTILFEDTLIGDPEDVLDAPGDVAITMANALGLQLSDDQIDQVEGRETSRLDALLAYLSGADLRTQHGITRAIPADSRAKLFEALTLDPDFEAPAALLAAEFAANAGGGVIDDLIETMEAWGEPGVLAVERVVRILEQDGLNAQAAELASAVLGQQPDNAGALALAGQQAYHSGHFARARRIVQRLLDIAPNNPAAYVLQGNVLAANNRVAGAAIQWELALELDPDQPKVLLRLGSYLATAGQYQRAYDVLSEVDAKGASTPDSLYQRAFAAYRLGRIDEAIQACVSGIALSDTLPYLHIMAAHCYVRAGRDDAAEWHHKRAFELLPSYWPSALALGYGALNQGRTQETGSA
jgi:tetratricopeptide (TPR) repeat protein